MVGGTISNPAFSNTSGAISLRGVVGTIEASRDGGAALELNRKTNDGAIINLRKDGTAIGSIGVDNSNNVVIEGDSSHSGIQFGTGIIFPHKNGALIDAGISLGNSDWRFQNLHLSGTANVGVLEVNSGTSNLTATFQSTDTTALIAIKDNTTSSDTHGVGSVGDNLTLYANGSERARLDASGNLLVGTTTAGTTGSQLRANGQVRGNSSSIPVFSNRIGSDGILNRFQKGGTTVGGIGTFASSTFIYGTGGGVTDTGLIFADSQIVPCNGSGVGQDDAFDLGTSSSRFDDVFATNGTINTSDGDEKQDIEELTEVEQRVAVAAKGLLRKFRWKSRVEEKGDDARIHFGIIAQDLQAAFEAEGLDAGRYAMFINSTWTDEETGEERSRMGVRYNELLAFIIAAI